MSNDSELIESMINTLEEYKANLEMGIKIQQAQKALDELIPLRLAENLDYFKNNFHDIYEHYKYFMPSGKYKLVCNENAEPNLLLVKENKTIYGISPFDDCKKQIDFFMQNQKVLNLKPIAEKDPYFQFHFLVKNALALEVKSAIEDLPEVRQVESIPFCFMFGLGLGFQLGYLYERFTPFNLCVVEPDEEMFFFSLCVFDYVSLIEYIKREKLGIHFYLRKDVLGFIHNINMYLLRNNSTALPMMYMVNYRSKIMDEFIEVAGRDFSTMSFSSGFFDDILFGFCHSITNFSTQIPVLTNAKLPSYVVSKPAVIVGNGPSLDDDIDLLAKYQDRCIVIACGTAYSALCKKNIRADIYIAVERTLDVYDSLLEINDHREFFMDTVCFGLDVVHPKTFSLFKHKVLCLKANEVMLQWLVAHKFISSNDNIALVVRANPLVSNLGLEIASRLGFSEIYLLGTDNGIAGGTGHSKYSMYYDDKKQLKKKYSKMVLDTTPMEMPGNFLQTCKTNTLFKLCARIMEQTIAVFKGTRYYNCSNGIKVEGADPKHFSEIDWDKYSVLDKNVFRTILFTSVTESFDFCLEKVEAYLDTDKYSDVIREVYKDWYKKPKSRTEFLLKEQYQSFYFRNNGELGNIGCTAISTTFDMCCNLINVVLYSYEDETTAVDEAYKLMCKYLLQLFVGSEFIYRHTLDMELGKHEKIVKDAIDQVGKVTVDEFLSKKI